MILAPNYRHTSQYRLEIFDEFYQSKGFEFRRTLGEAVTRMDALLAKDLRVWVFHINDAGQIRRLRNRELIRSDEGAITAPVCEADAA